MSEIPNVTPGARSGSGERMPGGTYRPPGAAEPEQPDDSEETTEGTDVPTGTIQEVMAWVAGDPERAEAALDAEQQRSNPRSTLITALRQLAG